MLFKTVVRKQETSCDLAGMPFKMAMADQLAYGDLNVVSAH